MHKEAKVLSQSIQKSPSMSSIKPTLAAGQLSVASPTISAVFRRKTRLGIVVDDYANRFGTLSSLEHKIGKTIDTVSIFKQFGNPHNSKLIQADLAYIKNTDKTLLVAWEPWNPDEELQQTYDYLSEINSGKQDSYITEVAESIKAYGSPVVIRFGHEMNGNWYPWGQRPEAYRAAYRHIVNVFENIMVNNVRWMWSINAENVPRSPINTVQQYYPGDDVVDIVGIDGFNFGSTNGQTWRTFSEIFAPAYAYILTYNKPIIVSETASAEEGGNKAEWIKNMFQKELQNQFSHIDEVIWFNLIKEADWRIDSTKSSLQTFSTLFK